MNREKRSYVNPPDVFYPEALLQSAARRRKALEEAGCSTYSLGYFIGNISIVCLCCGLGSMHPEDIAQKYCGFCHAYHCKEKPDGG